MEKIPTAAELLTNILSSLDCYETISYLKSEDGKSDLDNLITLINSRTKLHIEQALSNVDRLASLKCNDGKGFRDFIDENSIIDAYPLTNIK